MKITYPVGGSWPMVIEDVDVRTCSDDLIQEIGYNIADKALVVIKKQNLSVEDEIAFVSRFGNPDRYPYDKKLLSTNPWFASTKRDHPAMSSVTGALDANGNPGLHGMKEDLDWHCGQPWNPERPDIVYLYACYGSVGSRTTYVNSMLSYNDLSEEWKNRIADITLRPTSDMSRYSESGKIFEGYVNQVENPNYHPPVVYTNKTGHQCIFLPFLQMEGLYNFAGTAQQEQEIIEYLKNHMLDEKYTYHHDWDDGDIVMHDNWTGLHKRWYFEHMDTRLLHRMQFDMETIKF
jgi:alpha-ketoglutarate-dependent taurine dioxygenase